MGEFIDVQLRSAHFFRYRVRMKSKLFFFLGLLLVLGYCWQIRPPGFIRGYLGDHCVLESTRQLIAEQVTAHGRPTFETQNLMAPYGISVAYLPGTLELSGLGAAFWKWDKDFPFFYLYFIFSLVLTYVGVGIFSRKLSVPGPWSWTLALLITVFNIARHYKHWFHMELLFLHWFYLSLFLDAIIWKKFIRERKWDWSLEAWRGWMLLTMLGTGGYFWGPLILEWVLLRGWMGWLFKKKNHLVKPEGSRPSAIFAAALSAVWFGALVWWFGPLLAQVRVLGLQGGGISWFAEVTQIISPIWLDDLWSWVRDFFGVKFSIRSFEDSETIVTVGWVLWIPTLLAIWRVRSTGRGVVRRMGAPFICLLVLGLIYSSLRPPFVQKTMQTIIPFMSFFRTASRWGLMIPAILGVLIALSWPELDAWVRARWRSKNKRFRFVMGLYLALSAVEISHLRIPVEGMKPLGKETQALLQGVRETPGTTVLDLPFCVAGANGVCTNEQCSLYPLPLAGICFRQTHEKAVFGTYQSRLVEAQCGIYRKPPFTSWFNAWASNRCWSDEEWKDFCSFVGDHRELSAVLVYPDFWKAASKPACWRKFEENLGRPIQTAIFPTEATRGDRQPAMGRLVWFAPHCVKLPHEGVR